MKTYIWDFVSDIQILYVLGKLIQLLQLVCCIPKVGHCNHGIYIIIIIDVHRSWEGALFQDKWLFLTCKARIITAIDNTFNFVYLFIYLFIENKSSDIPCQSSGIFYEIWQRIRMLQFFLGTFRVKIMIIKYCL